MATARHFHSMPSRNIRCVILQADVAVLTPRWRRLRTERQERVGRDELELFIDPKLKHGVGDAAIPASLACHCHEFRNLRLGKDVHPLLVGEIELM